MYIYLIPKNYLYYEIVSEYLVNKLCYKLFIENLKKKNKIGMRNVDVRVTYLIKSYFGKFK